MKKNLLVLVLATFTAGSMVANEDGGFFRNLGHGIEQTFEGAGKIAASPTQIGQSKKKQKNLNLKLNQPSNNQRKNKLDVKNDVQTMNKIKN